MRVSIVTLVAAAYTGLATACSQQPVGPNPSDNPISATVLEVVEAGKPFVITWNVLIWFLRLSFRSHADWTHSPPPQEPCPLSWSRCQRDPDRLLRRQTSVAKYVMKKEDWEEREVQTTMG